MPSPVVLVAALAALSLAVWALRRQHRRRRRQRAVGQLLDAADALEARLRDAREQVGAATGGHADPVREAMQEMLRHRLWLQQHGDRAPLAQIEQVRDAILGADLRMRGQLPQLRTTGEAD